MCVWSVHSYPPWLAFGTQMKCFFHARTLSVIFHSALLGVGGSLFTPAGATHVLSFVAPRLTIARKTLIMMLNNLITS
jgi:hypothetical protein